MLNKMIKAVIGNGHIQFEQPVANYDRFIQACLLPEFDSNDTRSEEISITKTYFLGWYPGKTKGRFIENDSLELLYPKISRSLKLGKILWDQRCYATRIFSVQPLMV